MVDIFSRRDGPRPEDVAARKVIEAHRPQITAIADRLTAGGYSASRRAAEAKAPAAGEPEGRRSRVHALQTGPAAPAEPSPYIRISPNNRVVIADASSARQLHFLGELRRRDGQLRFVLATGDNGFISPLAPDLAKALADLDGAPVGGRQGEKLLAAEIATRLGMEA